MPIFDAKHQGLLPAGVEKNLPQEGKGAGAPCLGTQLGERFGHHRDVEQLQQEGGRLMWCQSGCCEHAVHGSSHRRRCGALQQSTMLPQHVEDRAVGRGRAVWEAVSLVVGHCLLGDLLDKFVQEARFAHAGFPDDTEHLPLALHRLPQVVVQDGQLPLPPHIARQWSTSPPGHPAVPLPHALHRVEQEGGCLSGAVERASRHAVYLSLHQLIGRGTQENGIRVRQLLQYCGQSGCRPYGSVELLRGIGESPHHERPGMEPQTEDDTLASGLSAEGCLLLQVLAQLHRRQHRPPRMVLVRDRGTKQPHKPLPAHLHERAVVTLHDVLHLGQ